MAEYIVGNESVVRIICELVIIWGGIYYIKKKDLQIFNIAIILGIAGILMINLAKWKMGIHGFFMCVGHIFLLAFVVSFFFFTVLIRLLKTIPKIENID